MIFVGDLFQLAGCRIFRKGEIHPPYESPYFFSRQVFRERHFEDFHRVENVYRQVEQDFIELLNAIGTGTDSPEEISNGQQEPPP